MSKFVAQCLRSSGTRIKNLGTFNTRDEAVNALVEWAHDEIEYCLDHREDRIEALQFRNTYICGCGPSKLMIKEIEDKEVATCES